KGEEAPTKEVFDLVLTEVVRDEAAIDKARFHARHFVLATDHLDRATWSDERILQEYRHQHMIEGHTGFRWLKGVAEVAPILLEPRDVSQPSRSSSCWRSWCATTSSSRCAGSLRPTTARCWTARRTRRSARP